MKVKYYKSVESISNKMPMLIIVISFLVGVIMVNCLNQREELTLRLMNDYYIQKLTVIDLSWKEVYFYLLRCRGIFFGVIFILMLSGLRRFTKYFLFVYFGISTGVVLGIMVSFYGMVGITFLLAAQFPHIIIYIIEIILLSKVTALMKEEETSRKKTTAYLFFIVCIAIMFGLLILGVFTESYFSLSLLKKIVKIM